MTLLAAAAATMAGCDALPPRALLPETLAESAQVPDFGLIRFWGDRETPAVRAVIRQQYRQVEQAARIGKRPTSRLSADYLAISGGEATARTLPAT